MRAMLRAVGIWPPAVALVVLAVSAAISFASGVGAGAAGSVAVWGPVPRSWLEGLAQLQRGDFAAARASLAEAESRLGTAPPRLLRARLQAALGAGDWVDAELTAEKLAVRAGAEPLRSFVRGLGEYARCVRVGFEAEQPGADPTAFDRAIEHATRAARSFQAASLAADDGDWPVARRNAERALERRTELVRKKERAARERRRQRDRDQPEPEPEVEPIEQEPKPVEDTGRLSAAELQALLQRLARAEEEKRGLRRAARGRRSAGVERDW